MDLERGRLNQSLRMTQKYIDGLRWELSLPVNHKYRGTIEQELRVAQVKHTRLLAQAKQEVNA